MASHEQLRLLLLLTLQISSKYSGNVVSVLLGKPVTTFQNLRPFLLNWCSREQPWLSGTPCDLWGAGHVSIWWLVCNLLFIKFAFNEMRKSGNNFSRIFTKMQKRGKRTHKLLYNHLNKDLESEVRVACPYLLHHS